MIRIEKIQRVRRRQLKVEKISPARWKLFELRPQKGRRGGLHWVCIAIGTKKLADLIR